MIEIKTKKIPLQTTLNLRILFYSTYDSLVNIKNIFYESKSMLEVKSIELATIIALRSIKIDKNIKIKPYT
ncbi:protein of unknown function [Vibrio tapetis subsp. tapetis]|uniref:Uncharacterized protein n=1 Tax=Vibrio tapetis subsp. tapetis TaxID=1671868 RepID=A0A2N8ZDI4_9VIBR|nr:protein of unknown function [Vibrio tapetis subsp. tapetis]